MCTDDYGIDYGALTLKLAFEVEADLGELLTADGFAGFEQAAYEELDRNLVSLLRLLSKATATAELHKCPREPISKAEPRAYAADNPAQDESRETTE